MSICMKHFQSALTQSVFAIDERSILVIAPYVMWTIQFILRGLKKNNTMEYR